VETTPAERVLAKANFDGIYDQPDPRRYFHTLGAYGYAAPHYGQLVFRRVLAALPVERPTLLDLCCSYGINAALLKYDMDLDDLYERYRADDVAHLPASELARLDRAFFARRRSVSQAPRVIGLDTAGNAVDYAVAVGLLEQGAVENLEVDEPSPSLVEAMGTIDLVTVTGGIGYITERTFDRLLAAGAAADCRPWYAALCLRTVPFEPIAECLTSHGLVVEQLDGVTFPQRCFTNDEEREYALSELDAMGIDAEGREAEGAYHVNIFLARPEEDVAEQPIDEIFGDLATTADPFVIDEG
jgi:hypothetical protein